MSIVAFSVGLLFASITGSSSSFFKSFSVFAQTADKEQPAVTNSDENYYSDYVLPYPGKILPDSPLWFLKAARDRAWLFLTRKPQKRAELKVLFADKRLVMARMLFEKGKTELGVSTLSKAEKYLEESSSEAEAASTKGVDTNSFLIHLSKASLMHQYEIEENILKTAPSDVKPDVLKLVSYPKRIYENSRNKLLDRGIDTPKNPFDGEN